MTGMTGNAIDGSGSPGNSTFIIVGNNISSCATGIVPPLGGPEFQIVGNIFGGHTLGGIVLPSSVASGTISSNAFVGNGSSTVAQISGAAANASSRINIIGNTFSDTRTGGLNVTNHIKLAAVAPGPTTAQVIGNTFYGSQSDAVSWTSRTTNRLLVNGNIGYNDIRGHIASPFNASQLRVGACGASAAPVASTAYVAEGTDLMLSVAGGTGVSITIIDPGGTTFQSGLSSYVGVLPAQWSINFGAFSVAPTTCYVSVL